MFIILSFVKKKKKRPGLLGGGGGGGAARAIGGCLWATAGRGRGRGGGSGAAEEVAGVRCEARLLALRG
jgi:hypothetical protein